VEVHLDATIERVERYTAGHDRAKLLDYYKVVKLEAVSLGGRRDGSGDSIHWVTSNCGNVENWVHYGLPRDETGSERHTVDLGMMQCTVYAVLSECFTRCILYSVYAEFGVCCTGCMLYSVYAVLGVCCTRCMLYSVYAVFAGCCTRCEFLIMAWRDREG
jgi:hypothetical protein